LKCENSPVKAVPPKVEPGLLNEEVRSPTQNGQDGREKHRASLKLNPPEASSDGKESSWLQLGSQVIEGKGVAKDVSDCLVLKRRKKDLKGFVK